MYTQATDKQLKATTTKLSSENYAAQDNLGDKTLPFGYLMFDVKSTYLERDRVVHVSGSVKLMLN